MTGIVRTQTHTSRVSVTIDDEDVRAGLQNTNGHEVILSLTAHSSESAEDADERLLALIARLAERAGLVPRGEGQGVAMAPSEHKPQSELVARIHSALGSSAYERRGRAALEELVEQQESFRSALLDWLDKPHRADLWAELAKHLPAGLGEAGNPVEQLESARAALLDMQRQRDLGEDMLRDTQRDLEETERAREEDGKRHEEQYERVRAERDSAREANALFEADRRSAQEQYGTLRAAVDDLISHYRAEPDHEYRIRFWQSFDRLREIDSNPAKRPT